MKGRHKKKMDFIVNLPSDKIPLSSDEKDVLQWLYPTSVETEQVVTEHPVMEKPNTEKEVIVQNKISIVPLLIMIGLIFLFTFRPIDQFLQNKIPSLFQNAMTNSLIKTILFIGILLFAQFVTVLIRNKRKK